MLRSSNSNSNSNNKNKSAGPIFPKLGQPSKPELKIKKVEKLKNARDYSFLSDDTAEDQGAAAVPTSEYETRRSAQPQMPLASSSSNSNGKGGIREESRKATAVSSLNGQLQLGHSKDGRFYTSSSAKDSKKLPAVINNGNGRSNGSGSGAGRTRITPTTGTKAKAKAKAVPPKTPVTSSAPIARNRNLPPTSHKLPKTHPAAAAAAYSQLKKDRIMTQRQSQRPAGISTTTTTKQQQQQQQQEVIRKPAVNQVSSHAHVQRPKKKKKVISEGEEALMMIRSMFGTHRYPVCDDDDDISDMEASFQDILKEERHTTKEARREDAEQLRLIEEEERQERIMRKQLANKRKLSHR